MPSVRFRDPLAEHMPGAYNRRKLPIRNRIYKGANKHLGL
jgi:hypothetical protein